jgi:hypothetical protein
MRFPFFFSAPFLAYARLRGLSWREEVDGVIHGYWDFRGSWLMGKVYPWVLWMDAALASIWKIYLPLLLGRTLVCERYVLDMLADFIRATGDDRVLRSAVGRLFRKLIPASSVIVCLDVEADTARQRRPDLAYDKALEEKLAIYRNLAAELGFPLLSSEEPVDAVHQNLLGLIKTL